MKLYYAQVTDINDSDNKGRVQVRLLPEMESFKVADLPWVIPFWNLGMNTYSFTPPAEDTYVWVTFTDEYFKKGFLVSEVFIQGLFDYNTIKGDISAITDLGSQSYPDLQFRKLQDGAIEFYNIDTTERGILHPSGSWFIFDKDGNIILNSVGDVELTGGTVKMTGNATISGALEVNTGGENLVKFTSLNTVLNTLFTLIDTHIHVDPLSGSTGPPATPTFATTLSANINTAQANNVKSS